MPYPFRYVDPEIELIGSTARASLKSIKYAEISNLLKQYGFDKIEPTKWYRVNEIIEVFATMYAQEKNVSEKLVSIGIAIIETAELPPEVEDWSLEQQLSLIVTIHNELSFRPKSPGLYKMEWLADNHIKYIEDTPWPDALVYGYIYGIARRFLTPKGLDFTVRYDPDARQDLGGDETILYLQWNPNSPAGREKTRNTP